MNIYAWSTSAAKLLHETKRFMIVIKSPGCVVETCTLYATTENNMIAIEFNASNCQATAVSRIDECSKADLLGASVQPQAIADSPCKLVCCTCSMEREKPTTSSKAKGTAHKEDPVSHNLLCEEHCPVDSIHLVKEHSNKFPPFQQSWLKNEPEEGGFLANDLHR